METLHSAIDDLKCFFRDHAITSLQPVVRKKQVTIDFELPVEGYIAPGKRVSVFTFKLTLWERQGKRAGCRIVTKPKSPVPFHPHFKIKPALLKRSLYGEWVGCDRDDLSVSQQVEHMLSALQFKPGYIDVNDHSRIGNKKALLWFLKNYYLKNERTTGDHTPKKHFEVNTQGPQPEKKRFEVSSGNTQSKKKFKIQNEVAFKPAVRTLPDYDVERELNSRTDRLQSPAKIFITPAAREQIFSHIRWGERDVAETMLEQGGLLLGKVYFDETERCNYGIAERGIAGRSAQGTATHLEMTHETWQEMMEKVDHLLEMEENKDLQIIGWYHTHPNHLDVFMSGTDMNTQQNYFNQDWHFAIVLNPQRQIWKAFSGQRSLECKGFFLAANGATGSSWKHSGYNDSRAARSEFEEETRYDYYSGEKPFGLQKLFLTLALALLVLALVVFFISTRDKKENVTQAKQETEKKETTPSQPQQPKAQMPKPEPPETKKTTLKEGTIIYDNGLNEMFKEPLANSLEVSSTTGKDPISNIEVQVFVYKSEMEVRDDSSLNVFGTVRNTKKASRNTLVGDLKSPIVCSKEDYTKEGNWYLIKLQGLVKP
jgi:proteasome lid subunit RPN8/RPN11